MRWSQRAEYVFQTVARGLDHRRCLDGPCASGTVYHHGSEFEVHAGEVSKGVTRRHAVLQTLASDICERLPRAYGVLNVQIWTDKSGTATVIEVNARYRCYLLLDLAVWRRLPDLDDCRIFWTCAVRAMPTPGRQIRHASL